jgi:hypothetical protein
MLEQSIGMPAGGFGAALPRLWRLLTATYGLLFILSLAGYVTYDSLATPDDRSSVAVAAAVQARSTASRVPPKMVAPMSSASVYLVCDAPRAAELNMALERANVYAVVLVDGDTSRFEARHVLADMQARGLVMLLVYEDCENPPPVENLVRVLAP